jgi:adenylate cyclase
LFEVQDEVVRAVVASTHTRLLINEGTIPERLSGTSAHYWELAKRGMAAGWDFTPEGLNEAVSIGTHLADEFPTLARGHQILAEALLMQIILGYQPTTTELKQRVMRGAQEAVRLDPTDEHCLFVQGMVVTFLLGQPDEGIVLFERILSLNPNFVTAHGLLGNAYCRVGQPDKAIEHIEIAVRLDPRDPSVCFRYSTLAEAYFLKQEHQHSLHWARQAIALKPDYWLPHAVAAAACVELMHKRRNALPKASSQH